MSDYLRSLQTDLSQMQGLFGFFRNSKSPFGINYISGMLNIFEAFLNVDENNAVGEKKWLKRSE